MKIPPQYLPIMPYLVMKDAQSFLDFAKKVFGASEQMIVLNESKDIQHGEIKIHDAVIMFGQANANWSEKPAGMFIFVNALDAVFAKALENGATVLMEPATQDYGYSAGFEDPNGNHWWITQGD